MFNQYLEKFMEMTKAEIINEGVTWGRWDGRESNRAALMKYKKVALARSLADYISIGIERGYL